MGVAAAAASPRMAQLDGEEVRRRIESALTLSKP